jgi:hypothetical protein
MTESKYDHQVPKVLPSSWYEGPSELAMRFRALAPMWSSLVRNTDLLLDLVTLVYAIGGEVKKKVQSNVTDANFSISLLAMKLGERPELLSTDSIYKLLEELTTDMGTLQSAVRDLMDPQMEARHRKSLVDTVGNIVIHPLKPMFLLYNALSSIKDTPGDHLEEWLKRLEAGLAAVKGNVGPQVRFKNSGGPLPPFMGSTPQPQNGSPDREGLSECIKFLEDVQDEMMSSSVQVGMVTFTTRSQVKAWMDLNRCSPRAGIFFLDMMSMLALIHSGSDSAKSTVEFASLSKKVGYTSPDEALVVTSFSLELPEAFGSLPNSGVARDSRVLPSLPSYKEWDGGDGYNSLRTSIADRVSDFVPQMGSYYCTTLTGEALNVATEMLSASKTCRPGSTQPTRIPLPGPRLRRKRPGLSSLTASGSYSSCCAMPDQAGPAGLQVRVTSSWCGLSSSVTG